MGHPPTSVVRRASPTDAPCIARLSGLLGYPCDSGTITQRLAAGADDSTRAVLVACLDDVVAGWIEVGLRSSLESGEYAEIFGLIVDDGARRRRGVASALVDAAVRWAADCGQIRLCVRTNIRRRDAVAFYGACRFVGSKQQLVLGRNLSTPPR